MRCFFDRESVSAENLLPGNSGNQATTMTSFTLSTHHNPAVCVCASCVDVVGIDKVATALAPKLKAALPHLIPTRSPLPAWLLLSSTPGSAVDYIYMYTYLIYNSWSKLVSESISAWTNKLVLYIYISGAPGLTLDRLAQGLDFRVHFSMVQSLNPYTWDRVWHPEPSIKSEAQPVDPNPNPPV